MSSNNIIYINKETFEVFYQQNADEEDRGEFIGKGNSLIEAVNIADSHDVYPEYGIQFFDEIEEKWY